MRALWTGSLGFGLVNIPVRLFGATQSNSFDLDMLHAKDKSPIRYAKICQHEDREVESDEIVKGYEYAKGDYVVIDEEDLERAHAEKSDTIDITGFVDTDEVDPIYFEKPYYLEPAPGGEKAYVLLYEAMKRSGKFALARFVMRHREHIGVILPTVRESNIRLILNQIRFEDEIRKPGELAFPSVDDLHDISEREVDIAVSLIDQLSTAFNPSFLHDPYKEELEKIIEDKLAGKKPKPVKHEAPEPTNVSDLMTLLKASLNQGRSAPGSGGKRKRTSRRAS